MNIKGQSVILRAVEERDLALIHQWENDPDTQDDQGPLHFPTAFADQQSWFDGLRGDDFNLHFAIDVADKGIIGISTLISIDWKNRHAWHGMLIGPQESRGKGFGFDAGLTTMRYAFQELNFERLDGAAIEYNHRSIKFYCEKLGWKVEGRRRAYWYRRGRFWDKIDLGVTREDYFSFHGAAK